MVEQIADAILYEGYILYPYRSSALKNGQRWNFGVLYPPAYAAAQQGSDAAMMQCECLARGSNLSVTVRFLHLVTRDTLDVDGNVVRSWQEAIAREVEVRETGMHRLVFQTFAFPAREDRESQVVRRQESIDGAIELNTQPLRDGWFRVTVRISNAGAIESLNGDSAAWSAREAVLRHSLVSTHAILCIPGGEFASLLDPPEALRELSAGCSNMGLWPVLAGDATPSDTMLASPIILYDHPQIAPESAGALFDGTEIDEILSLRILALTDDEKREMRETDSQAGQLLERTESLDAEQWMRMHGVMRGRSREKVL
jgi:hydrogenase maturation protease